MAKKTVKATKKQMHMNPFKVDQLKNMMDEKGYDCNELCRQLGLRGVLYMPSQLAMILTGKRVQPRGDILAGLCAVFNAKPSVFYDIIFE